MLTSSLRRASIGAGEASHVYTRHASSSSKADFADVVSRTRSKPQADNRDLRKINITARRLISGMKQGYNPEWRHTYGRRSENSRTKQDLLSRSRTTGGPKQSAFEGHAIESWTEEDFLQSASAPLQPGTYYETRRCADLCMHSCILSSYLSR